MATKKIATLMDTLGMKMMEVSREKMVVRMPVGPKVKQPMGLLHGGATVSLMETAASMGSALQCPAGMMPVGIEINCNHLRSKRSGFVEATAVPLQRGRRIHVWEVKVRDEKGGLVAAGRCTLAVIPVSTS